MVAAGVRLCAHEGEVVLPDEERILLVGAPSARTWGGPLTCPYTKSKYIPIRTSEPDLESMDVWVGRGDRWVTLLEASPGRHSGGKHLAEIGPSTSAYQGCYPDRSGSVAFGDQRCAPGVLPVRRKEFLVYENTRSPAAERRLDAEVRELERNAPPMVDHPTYRTPTRILRRTPETRAVMAEVPEAHPVSRSPEPAGL
ncbi:hypothetical protein PHMEG_00034373 [Phytophthora megakarya]|uniref:Reverse transcriptase n=1 Tax=Phytophthora megakarya TaxID=4795 RepID=A0A225UR54_9STRA|nr:hypothetical protein PHMEG_00034373 [Phytophthora megakarya]